jgi:hypothetical protein
MTGRKSRTSRWIVFAVSIPVGCSLGAVLGYFGIGLALEAMGHGGHGALVSAFSGAMLGAGLGTFLIPFLIPFAVYMRFVRT